MTCPLCGAALTLASPARYGGFRFVPDLSVFRCPDHGAVRLRLGRDVPEPPRPDAPGAADRGDPRVRVPLVPRPTLLAGAIALPEPEDPDEEDGRFVLVPALPAGSGSDKIAVSHVGRLAQW